MLTSPFIVLEGPDGSGTTKHAELLVSRLVREQIPVFATAEPSTGPIGTSIREFLKSGSLAADALQLLFTADRADHIQREIAPALSKGSVVVTDRYLHSTLAYGKALGLPLPWLEGMNSCFPKPTCVVLTLPPFSVCQERLSRRETKDSLEQESLQRTVYDCYIEMAKNDPTIRVVDTSGEKEDVHENIWDVINQFLPR